MLANFRRRGKSISRYYDDPEVRFKEKYDEDLENELIEELNRRYDGQDEEDFWQERQRRFRALLRGLAFVIALLFLLSMLGRGFHLFTWSPWDLLEEGRELEQDPQVKELQGGVVELKVHRPSTLGEVRGTGFNLSSEGLVITNRHVVEDALSVKASFRDHGSYRSVSWDKCEEADLAVLYLDVASDIELPSLEMATQEASLGDEIMVIGNPRQLPRLPALGQVVGFQQTSQEEAPKVMILKAPIHQGSSGSPVFNQDGRVVGVVFATTGLQDDDETYGLAITVKELKKFLNYVDHMGS